MKDIKLEESIKKRIEESPTVFSAYYNNLIEEGKSPGTVRTYMRLIFQFFDYKFGKKRPIFFFTRVSKNDVSSFLCSLTSKKDPMKTATNAAKATAWSALMSFFSFVSAQYKYAKNPVEDIPRPSTNNSVSEDFVFLSEKEVKSILCAIDNRANPRFFERDRCVVMLAIYCGLRISEILSLNIDDVDLANGILRISAHKKEDRLIELDSDVQDQLDCWLRDRDREFDSEESDALFISQKKTRLSNDAVQRMLNNYSKGFHKHITPQVLRNTFAINLYEKTGDILLCAEYLGYSNIKMMQKYISKVTLKKKEQDFVGDAYSSSKFQDKGEEDLLEECEEDLLEENEEDLLEENEEDLLEENEEDLLENIEKALERKESHISSQMDSKKRFGDLTAAFEGKPIKGELICECVCSCGRTVVVWTDELLAGKVKTCKFCAGNRKRH